MLTRDTYIALLEKRATDESSVPPNNSALETSTEYNQNRSDQGTILHNLFTNAGAVQSDMTATGKKVWGNVEGTKISGHPLLKMASREAFLTAVTAREMFKTASPIQLEVAFNAFQDELEKIATSKRV